jgi:polygalacturonase
VIDGVDVRTSLTEGVWADGIDPDGCRDLRVSNCTIETGDDALVFYSTNAFGPARPCEDITVTNCRLTSSSSAIKFCDGNQNCVRRVAIDNCVITNSNRGLAFMVFDGGYVSDVTVSNLTIECTRRDWFWWGDGDPIHFNVKRRSEIDPKRNAAEDPPAGAIRNVVIRNVIARGTGTSRIEGHPTSPLDNVTIEGLVLHLSRDPSAPYETAENAVEVANAKNIRLERVGVLWGEPASDRWRSALSCDTVSGLLLDTFTGRQARLDSSDAAVVFQRVDGAVVRDCIAPAGTARFLQLAGDANRDIQQVGNELRAVRIP